jgi:hypothetical protein
LADIINRLCSITSGTGLSAPNVWRSRPAADILSCSTGRGADPQRLETQTDAQADHDQQQHYMQSADDADIRSIGKRVCGGAETAAAGSGGVATTCCTSAALKGRCSAALDESAAQHLLRGQAEQAGADDAASVARR